MAKSTFAQNHEAYEAELKRAGLRSGPEYNENESAPLVWYDQLFEREATPTGTVKCTQPLRVGSNQNGLDVILVASHANEGELVFPAGATITCKTLGADSLDETFAEIGPSICFSAPTGGIAVEPDHLVCRFPLSNLKKIWVKVELAFTGSVTGGTVDCGLGYIAR